MLFLFKDIDYQEIMLPDELINKHLNIKIINFA